MEESIQFAKKFLEDVLSFFGLNTDVYATSNDDEIIDLVEFSRQHGFAIRFIEYMDVGNANNWTSEKMVPKQEILEKIRSRFPYKKIGREDGSAPAVDYELLDGSIDVGVIASVTEPFCGRCDRVRLTADGRFRTCLFSIKETDLKTPLRSGASDEEIAALIRTAVTGKEPGHMINSDRFQRPDRSMHRIGG